MKNYKIITTALVIANSALAIPFYPQNGESYTTDASGTITAFGGNQTKTGNVAITLNSESILDWASGYNSYNNNSTNIGVSPMYSNPELALGKPSGSNMDITCLGAGGSIVLEFDTPIGNDDGVDFAVFENASFDGYYELGYISVSSDGINFLTMPNFYLNDSKIGLYTNNNWSEYSYNLASKYMIKYGQGFDLEDLKYAYDYALADYSDSSFSDEYTQHILNTFNLVDLNNITNVKITDILGDGSQVDSAGNVIYDPYPDMAGSPGFDLAGVAVINTTVAVPEPSTYAFVFGTFALALAAYRRRK